MNRYFRILGVGMIGTLIVLTQIGCPIKSAPTAPAPATATKTFTITSTPGGATNTPTQTPTNTVSATPTNTGVNTATNTATATPTNTGVDTPTQTATDTITDTPTGTTTDTPTETTTDTPTSTPSSTPNPLAFTWYNDGTFSGSFGDNPYSGGAYQTQNAIDTTLGVPAADGTKVFSMFFDPNAQGGYEGIYWTPTAPMNLETLTTCTFWIISNQALAYNAAGNFYMDAAQSPSNSNNVPESLYTTWTQYTINIADGSRTDGYTTGGAETLANVTDIFSLGGAIGGSLTNPMTIAFDDVEFH